MLIDFKTAKLPNFFDISKNFIENLIDKDLTA